ncbi:ATP-dependent DNA ligase [Thermoflexus hugenholtzii]|uniref:Probable DNA ligase n=1 Tax=Thermoflexus hugenholtzii JAD2 TaxID=877466 RepID=A0A212PYA3_9CHLR|nr:ATP-dependent DNA ligase [Thermoflexus hugenholtzii]SNB52091.1 DNA ligase-1 [Thermoflexus hugenholtzii JAD2]
MRFAELVEYFERLEATTKRLEMFDILSELFRACDREEIDKVVYFCQEQLLPPFRGVEIGMAEKLILRAIARATEATEAQVSRLNKERGDPGLVVEELLRQRNARSAGLRVSEVYETLLRIAETTGEGSVERKVGMLAELLQASSPKEARYIARFVLGRLRLGVGDPTILDALSKAVAGDRSLRPELERAYNLCSDLGLVARTLFEQGIEGIRAFRIRVGHPIRPALAERLPSAEEIVGKLGRCAVEVKLDGFRCQIHKDGDRVEIFSRNLERTTPMFPELIEAVRQQIDAREAILEGEAVAVNEETGEIYPFQVTVQRKRKHGVEEMMREYPLVLFAFDLLYADGHDYTPESYSARFEALSRRIRPDGRIRLVDRIVTDDPRAIQRFFDEAIARGMEGIVAKRLDAPYQAGARGFHWIKLKRSYKGELTDTIDVVVVGYFRGRGMRAKLGIGALLGAVYDPDSDTFKTVAKIGSGLTEEEWVRLREMLDAIRVEHRPARVESLLDADVWVEPRYVLTVLADEITRSPVHTCGRTDEEPGYALRFPRVVGWIREDKGPEDATTVKEILSMFQMQKRVQLAG